MGISTRNIDGITILDLSGKITIGVGDVMLRSAVAETLDGGAKKLLLNMAGVTTIDSSGIGELVSAYTRAQQRDARLKLVSLPPKVRDILHITQLINVFEVYDDEAEGVKSYS